MKSFTSNRNPSQYLLDILDSIQAIESFLKGSTIEDLENNRMLFSATIRECEIIGEAISKLPENLKEKYPHISWRDIKDFRNILAHEYFGIDTEIVWDVINSELPILKSAIKEILEKVSNNKK